jgi:hypothetical protein
MLYLWVIILSVGGDVSVNSETILVTDSVNLKIKPAQSFRGDHRDRVHMCVFIRVNARTRMNICIYTVFLKKDTCYIHQNSRNVSSIHSRRKNARSLKLR